MQQMVMWEHPVLGTGKYWRECATAQDAAEECADIFAGQPVKIRVWNSPSPGKLGKPDYEINNG